MISIKPTAEIVLAPDKRVSPALFPRVRLSNRESQVSELNCITYRQYLDDLLSPVPRLRIKKWMEYWISRRYVMIIHRSPSVEYFFVSEDDVVQTQ